MNENWFWDGLPTDYLDDADTRIISAVDLPCITINAVKEFAADEYVELTDEEAADIFERAREGMDDALKVVILDWIKENDGRVIEPDS